MARQRTRTTDVGAVRSLGTVAIVGFPNVGKSTLVNRLTQTRAAVVHETPGVTRDRKELLCEWTGDLVPARRHGRRRRAADRGPFGPQVAAQARAAVEEADLVLFVVDARAGITPGDEELAAILRAAQNARARAREQDRRPARATATRSSSTGSGSATPCPLSALHGHGTGDLLDEIVARLPGSDRGADRRGGDPRRDPRPAERRQVVAPERAARARARDRLRGARARRATRSTPCCAATGRRSCSSTPPACGASGGSGRGSSTTRSCGRSRPPERADVALVLVDASEGIVEQDLAVADVARKAGCSTLVVLSKWDVDRARPRRRRRATCTAACASGRP